MLLDQTIAIATSYFRNHRVEPAELPNLLRTIHRAITALDQASEGSGPVPRSARRRLADTQYVVCLEDGKVLKSLKRHLRQAHNLSIEAYRAKWDLPADYPTVAPGYSARRSALAKEIGLGQPD